MNLRVQYNFGKFLRSCVMVACLEGLSWMQLVSFFKYWYNIEKLQGTLIAIKFQNTLNISHV
jgi:hypothetical protein